MKANTLIFLVVITFLACNRPGDRMVLNNGLLIENATILSLENGHFYPIQGQVVVEGETIVYVGEVKPQLQGTFSTIDGTGKYLIPGLIDSHVHVNGVLGMVHHHMEKYPEMAEDFKKQQPRSYLYFGFTTLINLGGISEEELEFLDAQPLKPDLFHTGRSGVSVANGYPMNFAPEEFRFEATPNFIYLESEAESIPENYLAEQHTPEAVVNRISESGAIAVKSYYESGFHGMPQLPVPTREIMVDLQQQANKHGLVLTVHGNSLEAHQFLTDVGVDIITHGLWNWEKYREVPNDSLPPEVKSVLDMQIEKQIAYTPTLTVIEGERVLADPDFLTDPQLAKVVPAKLVKWLGTEEGQWFGDELFGDWPAEEVNEIYNRIQAHGQFALKYLTDNGGLILFGTDTPSAPTYGNPPGYNGFIELKLMQQAGVPLDKILVSATIANAKAFKLDSLIGSIEEGKRANMLLMSSNPLDDIAAYDNIVTVILGGEAIDRKELSVQ